MSNQIVTDEVKLRVKSEPAKSEEVDEIVEKLKKELDHHDNGIGLAAIQIGIPKRIFILREEDGDAVFVNPVVADQYDPIRYPGEGCLSFPGEHRCTERFKYINIKDDLRPGRVIGGEDHRGQTLAVAAQHEMDHLDGVLFFDKAVNITVKVEKKVGRNEPCPCGSGKKYKRCCGKQ